MRARRILSHPLAHLAMALLLVATVQSLLVKVYAVPSGSMEQTLHVGDRILVNRLAYSGSEPQAGDVVVFHSTKFEIRPSGERGWLRWAAGWVGDRVGFGPSNEHAVVKRVIATEGESVECCDDIGRLLVDGAPLDEPYVYDDFPFEPGVLDCDSTPRSSRCFEPVSAPTESLIVLGDHRANSADSVWRCRGQGLSVEASACLDAVSVETVIGRVFVVVLPPANWGAVD